MIASQDNHRTAPATIGRPTSDAPEQLVVQVHDRLIKDLDVPRLHLQPKQEARRLVEATINELLAEMSPGIAGVTKQNVIREVSNEVLGFGPLQPLLDDKEVTEVMVNGPTEVFFERQGVLYLSSVRFRDSQHIRRIADRIVAPLGRRLDESSPMVDARLPDGSRVNVVLPPIAVSSPAITIRKFQSERFGMDDLIRIGSLTEPAAGFLRAAVASKVNIIISGGTGSGKTTMLNALSSFIPDSERLVTIEDPKELQLKQNHVVALEARPAGVNNTGAVTQRDLVRNALRMRPDRVIIGEVRGAEAFDMLQAMNTGHEGSITTIHANTPRDALSRVENMVMMAGFDLPTRAIREQVASALHLVVQVNRMVDGSRRVTHITEVASMEGDMVAIQDLFLFEQRAMGADQRVQGQMERTGIRPHFYDRFARFGVSEHWVDRPVQVA
ncbi:MAG: CpaF family protein [Dehalococcoidia bacterium]|nr:CpaF family protein [Dehalococcoidia bacterium]